MSTLSISNRLQRMPPYIFSEINRIKREALEKGQDLLSVAIGDPDMPTPPILVEKMREVIGDPLTHVYSPYEGTKEFRVSVSNWFQSRFNVTVNPDKEIIALIGSKEGVAHFPMSVCNSGDTALFPNPGYPIFETSIILAEANPIAMPLRPENGFLPDVKELEDLLLTHKPKMMVLNFPSNPTSAIIHKEKLAEIVDLAICYNCVIAYDNAYSEIYYDENKKPLSILEIPRAKEIAIEFHSFSKTFNMTGWRIGFAVGNEKLIAAFLKLKTNIDSGPLISVQKVASYGLQNAMAICDPIRLVYRERLEICLSKLNELGIECLKPDATFFVWCKVPQAKKSMDFCKELIEKAGLIINPGIGFGSMGEGFFRISLTVSMENLNEALRRLQKGVS